MKFLLAKNIESWEQHPAKEQIIGWISYFPCLSIQQPHELASNTEIYLCIDETQSLPDQNFKVTTRNFDTALYLNDSLILTYVFAPDANNQYLHFHQLRRSQSASSATPQAGLAIDDPLQEGDAGGESKGDNRKPAGNVDHDDEEATDADAADAATAAAGDAPPDTPISPSFFMAIAADQVLFGIAICLILIGALGLAGFPILGISGMSAAYTASAGLVCGMFGGIVLAVKPIPDDPAPPAAAAP